MVKKKINKRKSSLAVKALFLCLNTYVVFASLYVILKSVWLAWPLIFLAIVVVFCIRVAYRVFKNDILDTPSKAIVVSEAILATFLLTPEPLAAVLDFSRIQCHDYAKCFHDPFFLDFTAPLIVMPPMVLLAAYWLYKRSD